MIGRAFQVFLVLATLALAGVCWADWRRTNGWTK